MREDRRREKRVEVEERMEKREERKKKISHSITKATMGFSRLVLETPNSRAASRALLEALKAARNEML